MNTIRMIAVALPMTLLLACGGGGGGGGSTVTNTPTNPVQLEDLPDFIVGNISTAQTRFGGRPPTSMTSTAIARAIQTRAVNANSWVFTDARPTGDEGTIANAMPPTCANNSCSLTLPNVGELAFSLTDIEDLSLVDDINLQRFNSNSRVVMVDEAVRMIESRTAARQEDGTQLTFQTYGGWLDNNVFGVERIVITENGTTDVRLAGFSFGDATGTNPSGNDRAEWRGVFAGYEVQNGIPLQGDAVVDIDDFTSPNVDLNITGILDINSTASSSRAYRFEDMTLTDGVFSNAGSSVRGSFYGSGHTQVGGIVDNREIIGAFGATRQP